MLRTRLCLIVITFVSDFTSSLVVFAVMRQLSEMDTSPFRLGVAGGLFSAALSLSCYCSGRASDRFGRRRAVTVGTVVAACSIIALTLSEPGGWPFYALYAVAGGGFGTIFPVVSAWLLQHQRPHSSRDLLMFCVAWNLGMIGGHALGGQLFGVAGYLAPMYLAIAVLPLNFILTAVAGSDTASIGGPEVDSATVSPFSDQSRLFARLTWIGNLSATFSMSMVMFLFPKLAVELGTTSQHQGGLIAMSRMVVIGTYVVLFLTRFWRYRLSTALAAQLAALCGLVCLSLARNEVWLAVGLVGTVLLPGYNYFAGLFYSTTASGAAQTGRWTGAHEATLAIGLTAGALAGGWIGNYYGVRGAFALAAATIAVLLVLQIIVYSRLVATVPRRW